MPQGQKIVSKSDLLVLHRPQHSRRPLIYVRVTVERGTLTVEKCSRRCSIRQSSVNGVYDLKVVWVTNNCDVLDGNVRYSFEVVTPEKCYILQADSHRAKIDWMQALCIGSSQCLQFRGSYRPASWSNLEDLQLWLSVREVQYEYREVEEYLGASYTGKWYMGKPEGMGSMQWPDGHRYDGEFVKGKIEGTGTMLWLPEYTRTSSYTGSWRNGRVEGHGEMTYRDSSMYRGWWHDGMRHGHGRMEYREPESLYIGGWENDTREGYGVYHNTVSGEHYLGLWRSDKYHGPAILIRRAAGEGFLFHSGVFREGDKIEGSVSVTQFEHDVKWAGLFQQCSDLLQEMVSTSHSNPEVCHRAASDDGQEPVEGPGEDDMMMSDIYRANGGMMRSSHKECVVCSMEGFKSADHPFGILVNHLTRCFNESYSGLAEQQPDLLPHAVGELTSVSHRLHQLVSRLCPTVIIQSNRTLGRRAESRRGHSPSASSPNDMGVAEPSEDHTWLYPILLPSITDTLMTLYRAHCAVEDGKFSATLKDLDQRSDSDLCELLELMSEYQNWRGKEDLDTFSDLLQTATETFSKLKECRSPLYKLLCVQETNAEVTKVYKRLHSERDSFLAYSHNEQGQLVSSKLFSFVIVRSQRNLDSLTSEISFISDFAGSVLRTEEYGYLLTELKGCYQQLSELYVNEDEWV